MFHVFGLSGIGSDFLHFSSKCCFPTARPPAPLGVHLGSMCSSWGTRWRPLAAPWPRAAAPWPPLGASWLPAGLPVAFVRFPFGPAMGGHGAPRVGKGASRSNQWEPRGAQGRATWTPSDAGGRDVEMRSFQKIRRKSEPMPDRPKT